MNSPSCFREFSRYAVLSVLGALGVSCYILADTFAERAAAERTFTLALKERFSGAELCGIAGVFRSSYYGWLNAEQARRNREAGDRAGFPCILDTCRFRGYDKGTRASRCGCAAPGFG